MKMNISRQQYIIRSLASVAAGIAGGVIAYLGYSLTIALVCVVASYLSFSYFSIQRALDINYKSGYAVIAAVVASVILPLQFFYWIYLMFAKTSDQNIMFHIKGK